MFRNMVEAALTLDDEDPDPGLVELMRARVVRKKSTAPKNPTPGPGKPKGYPKPPGSGKKAGYPNLMSPEFRRWLAEKARPFELLAAVCAGREVDDGGVKRRPTLAERMRAAEMLTRKILPDLQATKAEISTTARLEDEPLGISDIEIARRIAFFLRSGIEEAKE